MYYIVFIPLEPISGLPPSFNLAHIVSMPYSCGLTNDADSNLRKVNLICSKNPKYLQNWVP